MSDHDPAELMPAWEATIRSVSALWKVFDATFQKRLKLPLAWYDVMVNLRSAPGGKLRMQALGEAVVMTRPGMTRLVDRMEEEGIVRREPVEGDRRGYYTLLTEKGERLLDEANEIHLADVQANFGNYLTLDDLRSVRRIMEKVLTGNPKLNPRLGRNSE